MSELERLKCPECERFLVAYEGSPTVYIEVPCSRCKAVVVRSGDCTQLIPRGEWSRWALTRTVA